MSFILLVSCFYINAEKSTKCEHFQYGWFVSIAEKNKNINALIKRDRSNIHTETFQFANTQGKAVYDFKWVNDCHYNLYYVYSNDALYNKVYQTSDSIDVYIDKIINHNTFSVMIYFKNAIFYDTLKKIKDL